MSHTTSNRPPPLPPRSPRPPAPSFIYSSQPSAPSFAPPPGLPPRSPVVSSTPIGPPPPLPPRPAGYEIRTPNNPITSIASSHSTLYAPSSPYNQPTSNFALPPPPPLGPPPPYTASAVEISPPPHHQPYLEQPIGSNFAQSISPSSVSGPPSPNTWPKLPPPPPGPPPRPSPHLSPGVPPYSCTSSRPSSPLVSPATTQISQPHHKSVSPPGINETHGNHFQASASSGEGPHTYQPSASLLQTSISTSNSSYSAQLPGSIESASAPYPVAPLTQTANTNTEPASGISSKVSSPIHSPTHPTLESSFQSLHLIPAPTVPPKSPLAPGTTQGHSTCEAYSSTSGPLPSYGRLDSQTQGHHAYPGKAASPGLSTQQTAANYPVSQQDAIPPASHRSPAPRAVTSCIDIPMTFSTDWYWHPEAPGFLICSRCYVDHIHATRYASEFRSARHADGKPRVCRFSKPRMKDHLYKEALASGSLRAAVGWMRLRSTIPDCKGVDGVKGEAAAAAGVKWYAPRAGDIPNFLACEACYEDRLLTTGFAGYFAAHAEPQPGDAVWACDVAIPYVEREYEERAKRDDWRGFAAEAKARITAPPCPGPQRVAPYGRTWFAPKTGPRSLVLCAACYCDHVVHSGEEAKWEAAQGLARSADRKVRCARGVFNIRILMAQAHEQKDFALFWRVAAQLERAPPCEADGVVGGGAWYTLPSHPREFAVCAACYLAILEPLGVARFWVRKRDGAAGAKTLCCFNMAHPRLSKFVPRLLEMYFTLDPTALDEYASVYASIPQCLRDEEKSDRRWYGWRDCAICPECYFDFARYSPLAQLMELHDTPLADHVMCEMYSKRMRTLYTECGSTSPPNIKPLLEYSAQRRRVYIETVPQIRMIIAQQRMALEQQKFLNVTSSHYMVAGQLEQMTYGTPYLYSAPGVGSGFANMNALQGAAYGQQAMGIVAGSGSHFLAVQQLEQRWRAVE